MTSEENNKSLDLNAVHLENKKQTFNPNIMFLFVCLFWGVSVLF